MKKVKLPSEICECLDSYPFRHDKGTFIWSAMQTNYKNEKHALNVVRKYIYDNPSENSISIINSILHGYEPEETEEERKEREIKEKMKEYLEFRLVGNTDLLEKITKDLYKIAQGKK